MMIAEWFVAGARRAGTTFFASGATFVLFFVLVKSAIVESVVMRQRVR